MKTVTVTKKGKRFVSEYSDLMIFIKFGSHRQRRNGLALIADKQSYYSFSRSNGKGVYRVTTEEYEKLKNARILFTRLKTPYDDLIRCH